MARGESGRIVLEIEPSEKEALYEALTKEGTTLKAWFLTKAGEYLREKDQLQLFSRVAEAPESSTLPTSKPKPVTYRKKSKRK